VNGAGTYYEQETFVVAEDDAMNLLPGLADEVRLGFGFRDFFDQRVWRGKRNGKTERRISIANSKKSSEMPRF
jgi:hypothetical protein